MHGEIETLKAQNMDGLLASYVAGALSEPAHVLVRAHLEMCEDNRDWVASLEALAGHIIEDIDGVPLSDHDKALSAIFETDGGDQPVPVKQEESAQGDAVVPDALAQFLGSGFEGLDWRNVIPGVKDHIAHKEDGAEVVLYWIKAGRAMPRHAHHGTELTLVLKGGFTDANGHYRRGDIAIADEETDHRPIADDDEDCICFSVLDAPVRLTGPIGRLISPFLPR